VLAVLPSSLGLAKPCRRRADRLELDAKPIVCADKSRRRSRIPQEIARISGEMVASLLK
jgi:hypothetical protein